MIDKRHLRNNFDLARLVLALIVVGGHSGIVSAQDSVFFPVLQYCSGFFAVNCFFVISGFLVYRSYRLSRSPGRYFEKRARRIYPAYFVMIVASVVMGWVLTTAPWSEFFSWKLVKYLLANLTFMNFAGGQYLPGVFDVNPEHEVNAPLWTLKIEVMFYVSVPVIFWLSRRIKAVWLFAAIYVGSVAFRMFCDAMLANGHPVFDQIGRQLPGQMSFFIAGVFLEHYFDTFKARQAWFLAAGIAGLVLYYGLGSGFYPLFPLSLGIVVIYLCMLFFFLGPIGKYGDFSYGLYIIHFPVLQTIAATGFLAGSPNLRVLFALVAVLALAVLMWHLVEKRFLTAKAPADREHHLRGTPAPSTEAQLP